ncbi:hypothetical protein QBC40DRAFT_328619 [Triangularia verruculosa]|uniref:Uncharacterized protein n=1 Tax=Triangularia verruculosa TaxID=2587418 RepID=A0AAN7AU63_9PEZI|nr:hypothetical protein QBC40DRAFT_328619 [Triangularia verruculosa]
MGIKPITPTEAQSLPELELRKCEYLALRAMLRHSAAVGFGAATTKAGLVDPTLITPAVAYCFTLLSAYKLSNVVPTLRILQKEVERRGLTPMAPKTKDGLEALAAVTFGQLTGGAVGGDLAVAAGFDKLAEEIMKQTLGEGITGSSGILLDQEVAEKMEEQARATAEAKTHLPGAGGPPPRGCTRQGVHTRIWCDKCGHSIDTAFESYSRQLPYRLIQNPC